MREFEIKFEKNYVAGDYYVMGRVVSVKSRVALERDDMEAYRASHQEAVDMCLVCALKQVESDDELWLENPPGQEQVVRGIGCFGFLPSDNRTDQTEARPFLMGYDGVPARASGDRQRVQERPILSLNTVGNCGLVVAQMNELMMNQK